MITGYERLPITGDLTGCESQVSSMEHCGKNPRGPEEPRMSYHFKCNGPMRISHHTMTEVLLSVSCLAPRNDERLERCPKFKYRAILPDRGEF